MGVRSPVTGEMLGAFGCWGWSDVSLEEAAERGRERAKQVAEMIRTGKRPEHYLYGDRPMREEIIEEWTRSDGTRYAAVTLNAYGCLVLNTASIMFVDVDLPRIPAWQLFKHRLAGLLGKRGESPEARQVSDALAKVAGMIEREPGCGVRVYRTFAGLRYLITHAQADPVAERTFREMEALGADPLYVRLCKVQACFRARLNPKPWRCGMQALPVSFPWKDGVAEETVRKWKEAHAKKSQEYATCSLIKQYGPAATDDEIIRVVAFHDQQTKAASGLALA